MKHDIAVYIGRFQPVCTHHIETVKHGLNIAKEVYVIVGSANRPRTFDNPFTAEERIGMFRSVFSDEQLSRIKFIPKTDCLYDDDQWVAGVEYHVKSNADAYLFQNLNIVLIGSKSDDSSWYLDKFPYWEKSFLPTFKTEEGHDRHAKHLREVFFSKETSLNDADETLAKYCYSAVSTWLRSFRMSMGAWSDIADEQAFIKKYKKAWENSPYPPTFVTVDAVVTQSSNVLLVKRGASPGRGLYALPGGFVNQNERLIDACVRELVEETRIDVPKGKLYNCIKKSEVFDHPNRSARGRTITHAYLIELKEPHGTLPRVKGSDDAMKAVWVPFSELVNMRDQLFEDHGDIIQRMVGGLIR